MMLAIQQMCARIGLVTGKGLTGVIKKYYSRKVLYIILAISFPSITLNIGADISGKGAVGNLILPDEPAFAFSILFTTLLMLSFIFFNHPNIATILK